MSKDYMTILQAPFKESEIEWRVGSTTKDKSKGLALAYVTNRAIQNRLDEVFGIFGWKNEYKEWKGSSQVCGISVWSEERKEWITKYDGADDSNKDAVKGGLSDAMKRAAYQWGIGRYLYNLPQVWCDITGFGSSYKLVNTPKLPEWALPKGINKEPVKKEVKQAPAPIKEEPKTAPAKVGTPIYERTRTLALCDIKEEGIVIDMEGIVAPGHPKFKAISDKQRNRLLAIAKGKNYAAEDVKKLLLTVLEIDSSTKLDSFTSYKKFVQLIEDLPQKEEGEVFKIPTITRKNYKEES